MKFSRILLVIAWLMLAGATGPALFSQQQQQRQPEIIPGIQRPIDTAQVGLWIRSNTDMDALRQFAEESDATFQSWHPDAVAQAEANNIPLVIRGENGKSGTFYGFSASGLPRYRGTHNTNAATTTSTDAVQVGGISGYDLIAPGLLAGVWDDGAVYWNHPQFGWYNGRNRVIQRDSPAGTMDHATHVAGTIGQVGLQGQRGMATVCYIDAYDWINDISEMASAFFNPMLVANHSWDNMGGWDFNFLNDGRWVWFGDWTISTTTDFNFGFYDSYSQQLDQTARLAPFSLIVRSAGNDRDDTGPTPGTQHWIVSGGGFILSTATRNADGAPNGYDCLMNGAVAKNVLTVGAVLDMPLKPSCSDPTDPSCVIAPSSIVITQFSSWGPTDDGRIKPDIVGNGQEVYSAIYFQPGTSNPCFECYGNYNGTSQAAPNVSGSLLLLQEMYQNQNSGQTMRAQTLKALAIHSADDAGTAAGPDYQYGYGLMNTHRAARIIADDGQRHNIVESSLNNGTVNTFQVQVDGTRPLKATIAWADPAGTPVSNQLNPTTLMLVNDLDLRLTNNGTGVVYQPWILNPASPAAAATTGDNNRDNVEQVLVANPPAGTYTVSVSHKGGLQGSTQAYSLIVSGISNYANLPYSTGFESGIDQYWQTQSSSAFGRIVAEAANGPRSGLQHLTMSSTLNGQAVQNDADLCLNLNGQTDVDLTFWWKSLGDEVHAADGVWFSNDGGATFTQVFTLSGNPGIWQPITLDVDQLASQFAMALTNTFVIRFSQFDDEVIGMDGFAFDDISVTAGKSYAPVPYSTGFETGVLDAFWRTYCVNSHGIAQVEPFNGPSSGAFHLTMQNNPSGTPSVCAAQLYLNLAGLTDVDLTFDWKSINNTPFPTDAVYLSADGGNTFVNVYSLSGNNGVWQTITLDLDQLATVYGVPFSPLYVVRFEQSTTMPLPVFGAAFDNISVSMGKSYASIPYNTGFETGLDQYWRIYSTDGYARWDVDATYGPHGGAQQLLVHASPTTPGTSNIDADLFLNLAGQTNVDLTFWWKEFPDTDDPNDVILFSSDGGLTFTPVWALHSNTTYWQRFTLDVDQLAAANSVALTGTFVVRFRHGGSGPAPIDGFLFDDISVSPGVSVATPPYSTSFEYGIEPEWQWYPGVSQSYLQTTSAYVPSTGASHLVLGGTDNVQVNNDAFLYVDFSGVTISSLSFDWKSLQDDADPNDGVFFSDDGGVNFVKVYSLTTATTSWLSVTLDVIQLASNNGLALSPTFVIDFRQTDDEALPNDGIAIDNLNLTGPGSQPLVVGVPSRSSDPAVLSARVYPNPSSERSRIDITLKQARNLTVDVLDVTGRIVRGMYSGPAEVNTFNLEWKRLNANGQSVAAGVYYIRIVTDSGTTTLPLVVTDNK